MNAFTPPKFTFANELEDKRKFAEYLLYHPKETWAAANSIFPGDVGRCAYISQHWPGDAKVIEFQKELVAEHGEDMFLPTKGDVARSIWDRAHTCPDDENYSKLMRLYSEVRGFIEKPQIVNNTNQNNLIQRVMVISDNGDDDEWRNRLLNQQKTITSIEYDSEEKNSD